jgi:hypothetical protein
MTIIELAAFILGSIGGLALCIVAAYVAGWCAEWVVDRMIR